MPKIHKIIWCIETTSSKHEHKATKNIVHNPNLHTPPNMFPS